MNFWKNQYLQQKSRHLQMLLKAVYHKKLLQESKRRDMTVVPLHSYERSIAV